MPIRQEGWGLKLRAFPGDTRAIRQKMYGPKYGRALPRPLPYRPSAPTNVTELLDEYRTPPSLRQSPAVAYIARPNETKNFAYKKRIPRRTRLWTWLVNCALCMIDL